MTHDELMVKINQRYWKMFNHNSLDQTESSIEHRTFIQNQYFALRAVVELHTPVTVKEMNGNIRFKCEECTNWDMGITEQDLVEIAYPCPTIQAIEKELE